MFSKEILPGVLLFTKTLTLPEVPPAIISSKLSPFKSASFRSREEFNNEIFILVSKPEPELGRIAAEGLSLEMIIRSVYPFLSRSPIAVPLEADPMKFVTEAEKLTVLLPGFVPLIWV